MTLSLSAAKSHSQPLQGLFEVYRLFLSVSDDSPVVTLLEGNTPLIPVPSIARKIGKQVRVFVIYDGLNPTGR
ncbi:MAG: threonine synthase, partial [Rivularia sp. ALOHA_DT_140]|nr:threonine synthase [Rivularia sp. ALOHA_DT_140]